MPARWLKPPVSSLQSTSTNGPLHPLDEVKIDITGFSKVVAVSNAVESVYRAVAVGANRYQMLRLTPKAQPGKTVSPFVVAERISGTSVVRCGKGPAPGMMMGLAQVSLDGAASRGTRPHWIKDNASTRIRVRADLTGEDCIGSYSDWLQLNNIGPRERVVSA